MGAGLGAGARQRSSVWRWELVLCPLTREAFTWTLCRSRSQHTRQSLPPLPPPFRDPIIGPTARCTVAAVVALPPPQPIYPSCQLGARPRQWPDSPRSRGPRTERGQRQIGHARGESRGRGRVIGRGRGRMSLGGPSAGTRGGGVCRCVLYRREGGEG